MAQGDKYINKQRNHLSTEQVVRALILNDANGKAVLNVNEPANVCPEVTGLLVSNVAYNTFKVDWADNLSGSYDLYYGLSSIPAPDENTTPTETILTNSKTLTGLSESTTYHFYVRSTCGSAWVFVSQATPIYISPFLSAWYNALSVKPSIGLRTSLNILVDGLNSDGDLSEMDFLAIAAGMETEEQALRPLKTTGNSVQTNVDFVSSVASLPWSVNGWASNGSCGIMSGYNPVSNGVKYSLNSCFVGFYGNTRINSFSFSGVCGGDYTVDEIVFSYADLFVQAGAATIATSQSRGPNDSSLLNTATKSKTNGNTNVPFYAGIKRTAVNSKIAFMNGVVSINASFPSVIIPNIEFASVGMNSGSGISGDSGTAIANGRIYARATIFGSGLISQSNTGARLNTFFSSRGLNPYV